MPSRGVVCRCVVLAACASGRVCGAAEEDAGQQAAAQPANGEPQAQESGHAPEDPNRIPDERIPMLDMTRLRRPPPLLELGNHFLNVGPIEPGFEVPGGSVWQPSLQVFGTYRTALQAYNNGAGTLSEWANRLDLFANLQLTGTQRILAGIRLLDDGLRFSGYQFTPDRDQGWVDALDLDLTTLFFEGDLGEMFSALDPDEHRAIDWSIAVGRQPLSFQDGMLIDDELDAVGITRNNLLPDGGSNLRLTFLYGWNGIHRDDNREHDSAPLLGLFTESDWPATTIAVDIVHVLDGEGGGAGVFWGASAVQRIGRVYTTFRMLGSAALQEESEAVSDGYLLFSEVSWTPERTRDNAYVNAFWGIDSFASAARGPDKGGPLGRAGILFAAVGLGRYGPALRNRADEAVGAAIGYQHFLDESERKQLVVELGGRLDTDGESDGAFALGARYQQALGQRMVLQLDAFGLLQESGDEGFGIRAELRYEF